MAEQISVDRVKSNYPNNGFSTQLGWVYPFFGKDANCVVVGQKFMTTQEARNAAAALLTVAEWLEGGLTSPAQREL
jgi:hypothetical protein